MRSVLLISLIFIFSCSAEHDGLSSESGNGVYTKNSNPDPIIVADAKAVLETACFVCHNTASGFNTRFLPTDGLGGIDMNALADNTTYVSLGIPIGSSLLTYFGSMPPGGSLGVSSIEANAVSDWISEMGVLTEE